MAYPALPDQRMPYHRDGTVVGYRVSSGREPNDFSLGLAAYLAGADLIELNDEDNVAIAALSSTTVAHVWFFFPESREVTALAMHGAQTMGTGSARTSVVQGSNDSTNGVDGTWETATLSGEPWDSSGANLLPSLDRWRKLIRSVSFTGPKKVVRIGYGLGGGISSNASLYGLHLYGEKAAGATPNDLIFIDHDTTPGAEYTAPEDFGDRPLGTTVTRQFRVKNASTTKTANAINLQCNDSDFTISTDNVTWVVTIDIASLAAGAESATLYVRNTTPAPGNPLGPRFAEIVALVSSWS